MSGQIKDSAHSKVEVDTYRVGLITHDKGRTILLGARPTLHVLHGGFPSDTLRKRMCMKKGRSQGEAFSRRMHVSQPANQLVNHSVVDFNTRFISSAIPNSCPSSPAVGSFGCSLKPIAAKTPQRHMIFRQKSSIFPFLRFSIRYHRNLSQPSPFTF